jgi:hypothetical protein
MRSDTQSIFRTIEIRKETIERTNKCKMDHACLTNNDNIRCKIIDIVDHKIHFSKIHPANSDCCQLSGYHLAFGMGTICCCPVRKELFEKYRI